ncbi:protein LURP-one-related 10-like [Cynara cardunculus var. scolymus]|uniref:LURP1-like domain-containing protein n=1 Tax=Cynara cardunculus var. scolymus TaxID=59895 RepID=A0A103YLJ3_CYNCS|nr:protein LURP-one-related 10-like [Cynara cardunculus var. scolymus]KVI11245.1 LURP1-like domain-containing protein [Cynara cardunculus var. scolymus]
MMAASIPVSVIGPHFTAPYPFDIIVDTNAGGNLVITDVNHKIILKVQACDTTFHHKRVLLDNNDTPIATLREKIMSNHNRWKVFRGNSTSSSDMIFSTKQPNMIQFKTSLHVFLANKTSSKDVCDFKIKGSWSKRKCTIYTGDSYHSSTKIAQMHKMKPSKNKKFNKGKFTVTIQQNVDYAFVVALIAIIDAMKRTDDEYAEQIIGSVNQVIVATA